MITRWTNRSHSCRSIIGSDCSRFGNRDVQKGEECLLTWENGWSFPGTHAVRRNHDPNAPQCWFFLVAAAGLAGLVTCWCRTINFSENVCIACRKSLCIAYIIAFCFPISDWMAVMEFCCIKRPSWRESTLLLREPSLDCNCSSNSLSSCLELL